MAKAAHRHVTADCCWESGTVANFRGGTRMAVSTVAWRPMAESQKT